MERQHPVFHLIIPTTIISKALAKLKYPERCKLIGIWEKYPSENTLSTICSTLRQRKCKFERADTVAVTIFGLRSEAQTVSDAGNFDFTINNGDSKFQVIGELVTTGKIARFCVESVELPPLWLTLCVNQGKQISVDQICLDNSVLFPEPENVLIFEYNPEWLKYCIKSRATGINSIIVEAFKLSHSFPSDDENLKLLPDSDDPEEIVQSKYSSVDDMISNKNILIKNAVKRSLGLQQILHKTVLISEVAECKRRIPFINNIIIILIDSMLGVLLTYYLLQQPNLFSFLHMKIESVVKLVQQLLQWLRGSPAGFKLNDALNSLLWRFFSYHLHLWGNYIGILQPVLSLILTVVTTIGCLGLTVQIAFIKDILSVTTFHIYCLYIYASRLFAIQLRALKSLGRLFYGRKWNPLRNRVDSIQLGTSEMFVGSFSFTIAIFLAPTTIIYYCVFLSLRLPVLITELILTCMVKTMNSWKLATSVLILINSPRVADEIYLHPVNKEGIMTFQIRIQTSRRIFTSPNILAILGKSFQKIFQGELL